MLAVKKFQFLRAGKPPSPGSCNYFFFGAAAGFFLAGAFLAGAFVADGATVFFGFGVSATGARVSTTEAVVFLMNLPSLSRGICSAALRRARLFRKFFNFLSMEGGSVLVFCQGGGL